MNTAEAPQAPHAPGQQTPTISGVAGHSGNRGRVALLLRLVLYFVTMRVLADLTWLFFPFRFSGPSIVSAKFWYFQPSIDSFKIGWASLGIACLSASVLVWSAARIRRKASGRCPRCKYNLTGLPSTVCPECGTDFVVLQAQLLKAHVQRRRILGCVIVLALVLLVVEFARLDVYYDTACGYIVVSVPDDQDAVTDSRVGDVRVGMSLNEVEAILGRHTGLTGTCADPNCTTYISQTIYSSAWPIHYKIKVLPPACRTTHYSIWNAGPSVRLGADGRVKDAQSAASVHESCVRLW
ncbi:MAG: hypothetical protein JSV78_14340 [Phycisphaerales bacterium]|nr:MAG: hypothetical protein JSV78_14340 [Phycisphaerales bacterium]